MLTTEILAYSLDKTTTDILNCDTKQGYLATLVENCQVCHHINNWMFPSANENLREIISVLYTLWSYSIIKLLVLLAFIKLMCLPENRFINSRGPIWTINIHFLATDLQARVWSFLEWCNFTLELAFESIPLRSVCESEEVAIGELGPTVAEILKHRLSDLRAATSVKDLIVGHPRVIENGEDHQHMVIDLCNDYQIFICANHQRNPLGENGMVDWQKVNRIKILRIERALW